MKQLGWYFARESNKLNYGDNREIIVGETHSISTDKQDLELCEWGLHASKKIMDALSYSPGPIIYRVELSGKIIHGDDKMCATHRKYLWGFDATYLLRDFSRRCALDVIHLWDAPDVVVEYLKTGNGDLRAAAWAAAWAAARGAARDAAWAAAWGAARAAAMDAKLERFNRRLTSMVISKHKEVTP